MKLAISFIVLLLVTTVSAQNATIWGVGNNYEIDYLHSGGYTLDGADEIFFENEPSAEFVIQNVTNDAYDYTFIGFGGDAVSGTVTMTTVSAGFGSVTFPSGGMPVMLPLSYREEDDWMNTFSEQLEALAAIPQEVPLFNANASIDDGKLVLEFEIDTNTSVGFEDTLFQLPNIIPTQFQGKNNTYVNTTLSGQLSFSTATGLLFGLQIELLSDQLLIDDVAQGSVELFQQLDFVAVIPPITFTEQLNFSMTTALLVSGAVLLLKKRN
ncbi:MAG: hypothetical protein ACXAE3_08270 [Candidatus Kariarchaeaceae archaeon]|jgi:hypothetical protein